MMNSCTSIFSQYSRIGTTKDTVEEGTYEERREYGKKYGKQKKSQSLSLNNQNVIIIKIIC